MSVNMSYCRFENTYRAFGECINAIEELNNGDAHEGLSRGELEYAKKLAVAALEFVQMLGEISPNTDEQPLCEVESAEMEQVIDHINATFEENK